MKRERKRLFLSWRAVSLSLFSLLYEQPVERRRQKEDLSQQASDMCIYVPTATLAFFSSFSLCCRKGLGGEGNNTLEREKRVSDALRVLFNAEIKKREAKTFTLSEVKSIPSSHWLCCLAEFFPLLK